MRSARCGAAAAVLVAGVAIGPLAPSPAYAADDDYDCATLSADSREGEPARDPSSPIEALDIAEAQQLTQDLSGEVAGTGVQVAVVDSGVVASPAIPRPPTGAQVVLAPEFVGTPRELPFYHGSAMAGVIAGQPLPDRDIAPLGIAPGAEIVDVRFYDVAKDEGGDEDEALGLTVDGLVAALQAIRGRAGDDEGQINIVNISQTTGEPVPALEQAIRALTSKGAIVVTSAGNRFFGNSDTAEPFEPGEDLAGRFFPAAYAHDGPDWDANPRIVVAGSVIPPLYAEDPDNPPVALSSDIDVVVPTDNVVSYGITGDPCRLRDPSTSVAAAEVSGILAMLMTAFPDAGPDQLIKRLEVTAAGETSSDPSSPERYQGMGVVQPIEALTRASVNGPPPGTRRRPAVEPAIIPEPEPDVLAGTRGDAVWWGLAGGGGLVVALILRPVLARRRREDTGLGT